jgi:hypothetical protein
VAHAELADLLDALGRPTARIKTHDRTRGCPSHWSRLSSARRRRWKELVREHAEQFGEVHPTVLWPMSLAGT